MDDGYSDVKEFAAREIGAERRWRSARAVSHHNNLSIIHFRLLLAPESCIIPHCLLLFSDLSLTFWVATISEQRHGTSDLQYPSY